jgi:hypothetical protein
MDKQFSYVTIQDNLTDWQIGEAKKRIIASAEFEFSNDYVVSKQTGDLVGYIWDGKLQIVEDKKASSDCIPFKNKLEGIFREI